MDTNVSKNTFSHKFFKLGFIKENAPISLKYLLKQQILQTIDLYRQQEKVELDLNFIDQVLEAKIILFQSYQDKLPLQKQNHKFFLTLPVTSISYSCPIAFTLSAFFASTAPIIAENLASLLTLNQDNILCESRFVIDIEIVSTGWINFYFEPQTIGAWLKMQTQVDIIMPAIKLASCQLQKTKHDLNLFPIQYAHARCCCLLLLGARENLINLKDNLFTQPSWSIKQPQTISWLNHQQNLYFSATTEYDLLFQLITVSDSFLVAGGAYNWHKLALNLSTAVIIFLADCPLFGRLHRENSQKAIARLGLIALAQYWLQRILLEKLRVNATTTL